MNKLKWEVQLRNKYYHLLVMLVVLFFIVPFLFGADTHPIIFSLMLLLGIALSLRALEIRKQMLFLVIAIGLLAAIFDLLAGFFVLSGSEWILREIPILVFVLFILIAIVLLILKMFSVTEVTNDTIAGGISVYILLGFLWTAIYYAIYVFDHQAFGSSTQFDKYSLFYFSFETITTLGYGDIYPVNKLAMSLANLEVITGQMYIAIFISRLIGLHIVNKKAKA